MFLVSSDMVSQWASCRGDTGYTDDLPHDDPSMAFYWGRSASVASEKERSRQLCSIGRCRRLATVSCADCGGVTCTAPEHVTWRAGNWHCWECCHDSLVGAASVEAHAKEGKGTNTGKGSSTEDAKEKAAETEKEKPNQGTDQEAGNANGDSVGRGRKETRKKEDHHETEKDKPNKKGTQRGEDKT